MIKMKRNLPIALATLPFLLYAWFAYSHLSFNTVPIGKMQLNSLAASATSTVLVVFLVLAGTILFPSRRRIAACIAVVVVVADFIVSAKIYELRNAASYYIEEAAGRAPSKPGSASTQPPGAAR